LNTTYLWTPSSRLFCCCCRC